MTDLLIRKQQVAWAAETTKGTYLTSLDTDLTAAGFANWFLVDPSFKFNPIGFERNVRHPTLTRIPMLKPDIASFEFTHGVELAGERTNGASGAFAEPPLGPMLDACGLKGLAVSAWTISSFTTGTKIEHGETVTGGTSSATATVVGSAVDGTDTILYLDDSSISGTFSTGEILTGSSSGTVVAMTTTPDTTNTKWAWQPKSDHADIDTLSGVYYTDGKRWKMKGTRGNVEFAFTHADKPLVNFTWNGIVHDFVDGALLTGANKPVIDQAIPPAFLGVGLSLDDGTFTWSPKFNSASINMGNAVVLREDSNDADGWDFALINDRDPVFTFNPDEELETAMSVFQNFKGGDETSGRMTVGSTAGNIFEFRMPALIGDDATQGDRDGALTWDLNWKMSGGNGPFGRSPGIDNEIVIINR